MISYKPFQELSAFRTYARGLGYSPAKINYIASNIDEFKTDKEWGKIIKESEFFIGVIESVAPSPCSMLLYDLNDISEDIGYIKIKDEICCILDGYECDEYKYLKNDLLTVKVWSLIANTCKRANIEIPVLSELEEMLDKKTFDIYAKGLTCTVNQVDSDFATQLVMKYKPQNVAEMSAFVASIRPGFKSLLNNFLERKPYSTNVKELDELLEDSFHYLMYQESIMKYLIWLGIEESKTYSLIKKISKKKFTHEELENLHKTLLKNWNEKMGSEDGFEETWKVVEDASKYSFNASHSLSYAYDSLYCAYLKAHYPFEYYTEALEMYSKDLTRTKKLKNELKKIGIELRNINFKKCSFNYSYDKENNTIYKGLYSVKTINKEISDKLEELSEKKIESFTELLIEIKPYSNSGQMKKLIKLDFFSNFGKSPNLLEFYDLFNEIYNKKILNKEKYNSIEHIIRKFSNKETERQFKEINIPELLLCLEHNILSTDMGDLHPYDKVTCNYEFIGNCDLCFNNIDSRIFFIVETKKYSSKEMLTLYSFKTGKEYQFVLKNKKTLNFNDTNVSEYDIIYIDSFIREPKVKQTSKGWIKDKNDLENIIIELTDVRKYAKEGV